MKLKLFIIFLIIAPYTFAITCNLQSGGTLDNLIYTISNITQGWYTTVKPIARDIFFTLFGLGFTWQLAVRKVFAGDIEKLWVFFFTRAILGFFYAEFFVDIKLYLGIINYMTSLGSSIGGFTVSLATGKISLGPSEVMSHFNCIVKTIDAVSDNSSALTHITTKFTLAIVQVFIFACLAIISFTLIKTLLQGYWVLFGGFILTGFAGSSWTQSYWQSYLRGISAVAMKLFCVCLFMGILKTSITSWSNLIMAQTNINDLGATVMLIFASVIILTFIAYQLPEWAGSLITGQINANFGQIISGVAAGMAGGAMVGKTMMAGTSAAVGAGQGVKAAVQALRSQPVLGGIGGEGATNPAGKLKSALTAGRAAASKNFSKAKDNLIGNSKTGTSGAYNKVSQLNNNVARTGNGSAISGHGADVNLHK